MHAQMDNLPFEIAETAHALRRAFDRRAAALGATRTQWKVLFRLTREPGLRQVELAEMLDIEPITLTRIVDRLEEAGWVERQRDPADRRAWRLFVTDKAKPLVEELKGVAAEMMGQAFAGIPEAELHGVRETLAKIRSNIAAADIQAKASNQ